MDYKLQTTAKQLRELAMRYYKEATGKANNFVSIMNCTKFGKYKLKAVPRVDDPLGKKQYRKYWNGHRKKASLFMGQLQNEIHQKFYGLISSKRNIPLYHVIQQSFSRYRNMNDQVKHYRRLLSKIALTHSMLVPKDMGEMSYQVNAIMRELTYINDLDTSANGNFWFYKTYMPDLLDPEDSEVNNHGLVIYRYVADVCQKILKNTANMQK